MADRHALLIGIPRCDNDAAFPPIPDEVVRADITRMARSLSQSGYEITVLGMPPDDEVPGLRYIAEEASRSRCLDEIGNVCLQVPEGGTLLVYFSGHGVRIRGADFLVPRDFSRLGPDGKLQASRLVPVNFGEEAALCRAETLVCFVDACRNSTDEDETESGEQLPTLPACSSSFGAVNPAKRAHGRRARAAYLPGRLPAHCSVTRHPGPLGRCSRRRETG